MANQITDSRILVWDANSNANAVDLGGSGSGSTDNEIYISGTASVGNSITNSLTGILYDAGSPQNWSNNTFYFWVNCGIVGLLQSKDNGGFRIRFTGAAAGDFFEVRIAGNDFWPTSISGGWTNMAVDIEIARSVAIANGWTGGTVPATTAVQRVGYAAITTPMPRMVDNTWIDAIYRVPTGDPAVVIEGRKNGTDPWTWNDALMEVGPASGVIKNAAGGGYALNGLVQFGIDDSTIHLFEDQAQALLWETHEYVGDELYGFSARGGASGSTIVTAGLKSGSGEDATGSLGWIVQAEDGASRWSMDFNDPDVDEVNLYGSVFIYSDQLNLNSGSVSSISNSFIDGSRILIDNSEQLRNNFIAPNVGTGEAFMELNSQNDLRFCEFESSGSGHAIELTSSCPSEITLRSVVFSGYSGTLGSNMVPNSGSLDAAIYNNSGKEVTINIADGTTPSIRNGIGATTEIVANIRTFTFTVVDSAGIPQTGYEWRLYIKDPTPGVIGTIELAGEEVATESTQNYVYSYIEDLDAKLQIIESGFEEFLTLVVLGNSDQSLTVRLVTEENL